MEMWELLARESIRDLVARYNANGDSGRFDPVLNIITRDNLEYMLISCRDIDLGELSSQITRKVNIIRLEDSKVTGRLFDSTE